jgi:type II secretory ATPase GspE/PulE/Tfp pilus assembly ATPase PilB-like protein
VEDPVEITQRGLRQVQVQPQIGLTFASALRAFLRADPDVIMVGEMRDLETASIAVEASLTGHLVFSTLHTNNAPETIIRLLEMKIDPFTFADALLGVLAQRLIRRLCKACREQVEATREQYDQICAAIGETALKYLLENNNKKELVLFRGRGCKSCGGSGYKGRLAIHELLANHEQLRTVIARAGTASEIRELAVKDGMRLLVEDGIAKCIDGHTDLAQVFAVCGRGN